MADLVSDDQRNEVAMNAAPYFVRVDVADDPTSPETKIAQQGASSPSGCGVFVATALGELGVSADDSINVQVRIWLSPGVAEEPHLIYDRTSESFAVLGLIADFMNEPRTTRLAPPNPTAEKLRRDLGGPFDTDQALMIATVRFTQQQHPDPPEVNGE